MARRKREPDPNPLETRLVAMTIKAVEDGCTGAVLIYETAGNDVKVLTVPASVAVLHGLISRGIAALRDEDATTTGE